MRRLHAVVAFIIVPAKQTPKNEKIAEICGFNPPMLSTEKGRIVQQITIVTTHVLEKFPTFFYAINMFFRHGLTPIYTDD